jgi:hypothetical protein
MVNRLFALALTALYLPVILPILAAQKQINDLMKDKKYETNRR